MNTERDRMIAVVETLTETTERERARCIALLRAYHAAHPEDGFWEQCHQWAIDALCEAIASGVTPARATD